MKKTGIVIAAMFAVSLLAGCSSDKATTDTTATTTTTVPAPTHHRDVKGEKDVKGELRMQ